MIACKHWIDCGLNGAGCCASGRYYRPSVGVCFNACDYYDAPARGLGDTIAKVTKAVGIKPCGGCKERRKRLNASVPYP